METGGSFPVATWNGSVMPTGSASGGWRPGWRFNWRPGWRGLARGAALVLAPLLVVVLIMPLGDAESSAAAKASLCGKAVGPFTVHGTKVLAKNGSVFISYGMTVSGLQEGNWTGLVTEDLIKIAATANDWCANTIRIQVNQDLLLGPRATTWWWCSTTRPTSPRRRYGTTRPDRRRGPRSSGRT